MMISIMILHLMLQFLLLYFQEWLFMSQVNFFMHHSSYFGLEGFQLPLQSILKLNLFFVLFMKNVNLMLQITELIGQKEEHENQ